MCPVCPSSRAKGNAGKNCRRTYGRCKGDTFALSVVRLGFLLMLARRTWYYESGKVTWSSNTGVIRMRNMFLITLWGRRVVKDTTRWQIPTSGLQY